MIWRRTITSMHSRSGWKNFLQHTDPSKLGALKGKCLENHCIKFETISNQDAWTLPQHRNSRTAKYVVGPIVRAVGCLSEHDWNTRTDFQQNIQPHNIDQSKKIQTSRFQIDGKFDIQIDSELKIKNLPRCIQLEDLPKIGVILNLNPLMVWKHFKLPQLKSLKTCCYYMTHILTCLQKASPKSWDWKSQGLGEFFDCILIAATIKVTSKDNHVLRSRTQKRIGDM